MIDYRADLGILIIRIVFGGVFAAHGAQKLLGWFGGRGLQGTGEFLVKLGFRSSRTYATLLASAETGAGILVVLGFLGPVGPALIISVMIVAAVTVHWPNGLFVAKNGIEVPLLYATAACGLALTGYGAFALDRVLGLERLWTGRWTVAVLGVGVLAALANLSVRRLAVTSR